VLRANDVGDTKLGQDLGVGSGHRLRPDLPDAELQQDRRGEDARLQIGPDPDDGPLEVGDAELAQGLLVGGVGDDDVREPVGELLYVVRVGVDAQHLHPVRLELQGERAAEPAQTDHHDLAGKSTAASSQ